jgi:hypothetical protein
LIYTLPKKTSPNTDLFRPEVDAQHAAIFDQ